LDLQDQDQDSEFQDQDQDFEVKGNLFGRDTNLTNFLTAKFDFISLKSKVIMLVYVQFVCHLLSCSNKCSAVA